MMCLSFDKGDVITHYSLGKVSCGGQVVGSDRFGRFVTGKSVAEILSVTTEEYLRAVRPADSVGEFLLLKHLASVKLVLKALAGQAASGKDAVCSIASISYGPEGTEIRARLRVDLVTEKIEACERGITDFSV
ncbi:MAG: hypothetical protein JSU65_13480 [Candidatus Zixiibacteriota bacterium]|nr:MAG: hypothetical protein JSU65_13480 [candidate division Zixibacteria bacterium]